MRSSSLSIASIRSSGVSVTTNGSICCVEEEGTYVDVDDRESGMDNTISIDIKE